MTYNAPLLVLIGKADTVTPARFCKQMKAMQPESAKSTTIPYARSTSMLRTPFAYAAMSEIAATREYRTPERRPQ